MFVNSGWIYQGESDDGSVYQDSQDLGGYQRDLISNGVGLLKVSVGQMVQVGCLEVTCGWIDG